jgi:hypothetical protein
MSVASGFAAFFAATFFGIISLLFYSSITHHAVDFTLSYKRVGLPVGLLVLVAASSYLGTLWTKRQLRKS